MLHIVLDLLPAEWGDDDLLEKTVSDTSALVNRLGLEAGLSHSCYDPIEDGAACSRCDACRLRAKGFAEAGLPDPTRYA